MYNKSQSISVEDQNSHQHDVSESILLYHSIFQKLVKLLLCIIFYMQLHQINSLLQYILFLQYIYCSLIVQQTRTLAQGAEKAFCSVNEWQRYNPFVASKRILVDFFTITSNLHFKLEFTWRGFKKFQQSCLPVIIETTTVTTTGLEVWCLSNCTNQTWEIFN